MMRSLRPGQRMTNCVYVNWVCLCTPSQSSQLCLSVLWSNFMMSSVCKMPPSCAESYFCWEHTQLSSGSIFGFCSLVTPVCAWETEYDAGDSNPSWARCKASTLTPVLSLWPHSEPYDYRFSHLTLTYTNICTPCVCLHLSEPHFTTLICGWVVRDQVW